ncbi:hypothetical protein GLOTRDRAFT_137644 [Gloeophyllum trabeum ATCC 11539]|uniref:Uncharacterized protein n=1 Tax=Gloeophyllum trabeum (strain ATCC 11539 / FP-39264 / Madison 617) TaxID=670483 RepID=S7RRL7_GLOTA|nr:uncharacterized protein GLOTRDRAFT_137644 [Gloeophyllum trabeum ATCC 11539]EPQ57285.1 hypothetical protein GLOTRDRAFT_137644 [Gloeophyllum trabeum ATCC 11539]
MPDVKSTLAALKRAAPKVKVEKEITDTLERISGSLSLLSSTSLSARDSDNLATRFRRPLVSLYESLPVPSLNFAVAIFNDICTKKVLPLIKAGDVEKSRRWESVASAILSGVLDYLDNHTEGAVPSLSLLLAGRKYNRSPDKTKDVIATAFYSAICEVCLPRDASTVSGLSTILRTTAYMVLSDTAASFPKNQDKLRTVRVLGGKRLGAVLYQTKDYLVLENLLTLLGRIVPANTGAVTKNPKRAEFLRQVFVSPCAQGKQDMAKELVGIMENAPATDWDNTVMTIAEVLAQADISYPQPFELDVVHACGTAFPQPAPSDRLYIDRSSFFANVANEEDAYETMQVPYASVLEVSTAPATDRATTTVMVGLSVVPTVAEEPMKISGDAPLTLVFDIKNSDHDRFIRAIESRGLKARAVAITRPSKPTRISLTQTSALLDFTSKGEPVKDRPNFQDKVKAVEQLYKTNEPSDDTGMSDRGALHFEDLIDYPTTPPNVTVGETQAQSLDSLAEQEPLALPAHDVPPAKASIGVRRSGGTILAPTAPPTPVSNPQRSTVPLSGVERTDTQILRDTVFGTSEDDLSDVSDAGDNTPKNLASRRLRNRSSRSGEGGHEPTAHISPQTENAKPPVKTVRKGRMILESDDDDDIGVVAPVPKAPMKKKRAVDQESDIENATQGSQEQKNFSHSMQSGSPKPPTKTRAATRASKELMQIGCSPLVSRLLANRVVSQNRENGVDTVLSTIPASRLSDRVDLVKKALDNGTTATGYSTRANVKTEISSKANHVPAAAPTSNQAADGAHIVHESKSKSRKRKAAEACNEKGLDDKESVKRSRLESVESDRRLSNRQLHVSRKPKKTGGLPARKYGNRGKGNKVSSPPRSASAINFDAVPGISSDPIEMDSSSPLSQRAAQKNAKFAQARPAVAQSGRTTRAGAMRDRANKAHEPEAAEAKKAKPTGRKKRATSPAEVVPVLDDNNPALVFPLDPAAAPKETPKKPKVARTVKVTEVTSEVETINRSKKPKKAPWETEEFSDMVKQLQSSSPSRRKIVESAEPRAAEISDDIPEITMDFPFVEPADAPGTPVPRPQVVSVEVPGEQTGEMPTIGDVAAVELSASPGLEAAAPSTATAKCSPPVDPKDKDVHSLKIKIRNTRVAEIVVPRVEDVEMIDLTADSPVKKSVVAKNKNVVIPKVVSAPPNQVVEAAPMEPEVPSPRTASPAHVEEKTPHFPGSPMEHTAVEESPPPPRSRVTQYIPVDFLPEKDAASRKAPSGKVRNRVTFAPEVRESPVTPVGLTKGFLGTRVGAGGLAGSKKPVLRRSVAEEAEDRSYTQRKQREPGMDAIVEVLSEIQEVIVQKISNKVEGVRSDVRVGRKALLQDAAADLQLMRNQSVLHFNHLIDLESEYASYARKMNGKWEEMLKVDTEINAQLRRAIQDHDRKSLVKKMPKRLFVDPMPATCQKFRT